MYKSLSDIKKYHDKNNKNEKTSFGKSKRKNRFGKSEAKEQQEINKITAETSRKMAKIIDRKLHLYPLSEFNPFKGEIDETEINALIKGIPNKEIREQMESKLKKVIKHTQPASLGDLNRKINKDTKELTNNTNKIFDKVKKLVDRINKKDKRIIQLKNELEREKSISGTKLANNKETFELNRKNLQEQLNARNREIENIEAEQLRKHNLLVKQFSRINLKDKSKQEELTRYLTKQSLII